MKKRKNEILTRRCVASGVHGPKSDFLRIVKTKGTVIYDPLQQIEGRGAYITANEDLINKAKKKNLLARALRTKVDTTLYDVLLKEVAKDE